MILSHTKNSLSKLCPLSVSNYNIKVAELQLMKDQAEEAGVGVLMGYNKVSCRCHII